MSAQPLPSSGSASAGSPPATEGTAPREPVQSQSLGRVPAPDLPRDVEVLQVSPTGIYIQAGAFSNLENALRMRDRLYEMGPTQISRFAVSGTEIYRVRIGPLDTVDVADATLVRVVDAGVSEARLVVE